MKFPIYSSLLVTATLLTSGVLTTAHAANLASDNAANYSGANPWVSGSNGGTGFGAWTFANGGGAFYYLGDSTTNGTGSGVGINTGGQSWGMSVQGGAVMEAVRPLTGGNLLTGQGINLAFDNGFITNGGSVGFSLLSAGTVRFEYYFTGGGTGYKVSGNSIQTTTVGFTDGGMNLSFGLTDLDTFSFDANFLGIGNEAFTGTLGGTTGTGIDSIRLFNFNGGFGGSNNQYSNSVTVVPEPSTYAFMSIGTGALLLVLRRRRSCLNKVL